MENEQKEKLVMLTSEPIEKGITLRDLWYVIRKHIIAILVFIVVGAAGGFSYDRFQPTQYQTSATLMGNKGQTTSAAGGTYQDYYLADYVSQTLVDFVTQYRVIEDTVAFLCNDPADPDYPGLGYGKGYITFTQLKNGITAKSSSLFVTVTFQLAVSNGSEGKFAKNAEGVIEYHMNVLNALCATVVSIANETKINAKGDEVARYPFFNGNIDVMSSANKTKMVSKVGLRIAIGAAIGLVLAVLYITLRQLLDNRFKDADDVERILGLPVLASIPQYSLSNFPSVNKFDPNSKQQTDNKQGETK